MSVTVEQDQAGLESATGATGTRSLYLETYGCQMNEYDSGLVRSLLGDKGYGVVKEPEGADVILLNTCAVREKAHEKIYGRLQNFAPLKRKRPELVIGILGCMAQNLSEDLFSQGLPLDLIVGPDNYRDLPRLIEELRETPERRALHLTRLSASETYEELEPEVVNGVLSFVTIMRGCDNFCTFCVVPYTRGRERSRGPDSIVAEVQRLVETRGVREVTLLGQNVNSYRYPKEQAAGGCDFTGLVERLLAETDIARIRFTSPHPHDFPAHLLELMAAEERFCSQIHLPVQAGADSVLANMRRDYTRAEFLKLVDDMRALMPDIGLSTDVIVGFPGESDADFEQTLSLMQAVGFDMAFMFRYSEREHTAARKQLPDDVPDEVKADRLTRLISLQNEIGAAKNKAYVGRTLPVLVEGFSRRSRLDLMGRSDNGKVVVFPHGRGIEDAEAALSDFTGRIVPVAVADATSATLRGKLV